MLKKIGPQLALRAKFRAKHTAVHAVAFVCPASRPLPRSISEPDLSSREIEEQRDRLLLIFEVMLHRLPAGSDPSPTANVTEERRYDLDCIETGKVPGCVLAFDV